MSFNVANLFFGNLIFFALIFFSFNMTDNVAEINTRENIETNHVESDEILDDGTSYISFSESEMKKMTLTDNNNIYRFLSALEVKGQVDKLLYTKAFKTKIQQKLNILGVACGAGAKYFPQTISINMKCSHHKTIVCSVPKAKFVDGAAQKFSVNSHCQTCKNYEMAVETNLPGASQNQIDETKIKSWEMLKSIIIKDEEHKGYNLHVDLEIMFQLLRVEVKKHREKRQQLLTFATHAAQLSFRAGCLTGEKSINSPEFFNSEKEKERPDNDREDSNQPNVSNVSDDSPKLQKDESSSESDSDTNELNTFATPTRKRQTRAKILYGIENYTPTGKSSRQKKYSQKKTGQAHTSKALLGKKKATK